MKNNPKKTESVMNDWESLVSAGVMAREYKDNSQWTLGDLALLVRRNFGAGSLNDFSKAIGVNKNTILRYRRVSELWEPKDRVEILSHRHHMILALRSDRKEWLERAAEGVWSVEELRLRLKKDATGIEDKVKVGSILMTATEWEMILKWFGMCIENPNNLKEITSEDSELIERIKKKVTKLRDMEKTHFEESKK